MRDCIDDWRAKGLQASVRSGSSEGTVVMFWEGKRAERRQHELGSNHRSCQRISLCEGCVVSTREYLTQWWPEGITKKVINSQWFPERRRDRGVVWWVIRASCFPSRALTVSGVGNNSTEIPLRAIKVALIKLSSAPESIRAEVFYL